MSETRKSNQRIRAVRARGLAAVFLSALLAACSSDAGQGLTDRVGNLGQQLRGGTNNAQQAQAPQTPIAAAPTNRACPRIELRDGTQTHRVYADGRQGDPQAVRYQGSILRVVRECIYGPDGTVAVRFGISGRVAIGPQGTPGEKTLPIRAVLVSSDTGPLWSELLPTPVSVMAGRGNEDFVLIQQTPAFPIAEGDIRKHKVLVGFDS